MHQKIQPKTLYQKYIYIHKTVYTTEQALAVKTLGRLYIYIYVCFISCLPFRSPEVTLYGWWDVKIKELINPSAISVTCIYLKPRRGLFKSRFLGGFLLGFLTSAHLILCCLGTCVLSYSCGCRLIAGTIYMPVSSKLLDSVACVLLCAFSFRHMLLLVFFLNNYLIVQSTVCCGLTRTAARFECF